MTLINPILWKRNYNVLLQLRFLRFFAFQSSAETHDIRLRIGLLRVSVRYEQLTALSRNAFPPLCDGAPGLCDQSDLCNRRAPALWTAARNNVHCASSAASTSSPGAVLAGCAPVSTRREFEGSTYVENALGLFSTAGSVKRKVAPLPSSDSTQIFPPSRSINFRQNAKPIPLPGRSAQCKRLNGSKIRE